MPGHFKRVKVADELRQSAASVNKLSQGCNGCGRWFDKEKVVKVSFGCQNVPYCNEQCQKDAIKFLCNINVQGNGDHRATEGNRMEVKW